MHVVMYTKPDCQYCVAAKVLLDVNSIKYEENVLDVHFTREKLIEDFPTAKTFPVIVVDNFYVGGYNQLKTLVESKQTDTKQLLNE